MQVELFYYCENNLGQQNNSNINKTHSKKKHMVVGVE